MNVPGPHDGQVFLCWVIFPLSTAYNKLVTVNCVQAERKKLYLFVDMFVFLLGCVGFLLLFLLSSVQVSCHVQVGILAQIAERSEDGSLVDELCAGAETKQLFNAGHAGDVDNGLGSIEPVQEYLHQWIKII